MGFIVTNMSAGPEGVVHFYNSRGTAEQWSKEGKYALWISLHRGVIRRVQGIASSSHSALDPT